MSRQPTVEPSPTAQPSEAHKRAARLEELKRALQRQLRRKPNVYEKAALDRAALMSLRAEIAAYDPKATSEDVVRLDNAARRTRADFERIAMPPKRDDGTTPLSRYLAGRETTS